MAAAGIVGTAVVALAAAGDLDLTFGSGGVATTAFTGSARAFDGLVQGDGKVVAAGRDASGAGGGAWRIQRWNSDGTIDTSYGTGGATTVFSVANSGAIEDVALDGSGRVVAGGFRTVTTTSKGKTTVVWIATVVRFTTAGALDTTFGTGGVVSLALPGAVGQDVVKAVAVQPDGRIVVAGDVKLAGARKSSPQQAGRFVARLLASGAPDTAFGSGGVTVDDLTPADDSVVFHGIALQASTGAIVVGGVAGYPASGASQWTLTRYSAGGAIDYAFGMVAAASTDVLRGMAVDASDRIVAVGYRGYGSTSDTLAIRYTATGAVDTSFGVGGATLLQPSTSSEAHFGTPVFQAGGKIVFTQSLTAGTSSGTVEAAVTRLDANGAPDLGFGVGGVSPSLALGTSGTVATGLGLAPDGRIVAIGWWGDQSNTGFGWFAARFDAN